MHQYYIYREWDIASLRSSIVHHVDSIRSAVITASILFKISRKLKEVCNFSGSTSLIPPQSGRLGFSCTE